MLPWWAAVLRSMSERRTWFHGPSPAVVYVDAAGCGHLGAVIFLDDTTMTFSTHIPEWMHTAQRGLYDMEVMASLIGLSLCAEICPERSVLLRCDNRGATQTLVRGACKSEFPKMSCAAFWSLAAALGIPVWIEDVPGKINIADPPSRDCIARNEKHNAKGKRAEAPNYLMRMFESFETLKCAQFKTPSGKGAFPPARSCPDAK